VERNSALEEFMPVETDRPKELETIGQHLVRCGVSRRQFLEFCGKLMVAAPFGLAITNKVLASEVAREVAAARRLPVIWLHFQDCTGCTETLLRTSKPDLGELLLHLISLDYHETLMAAAGKAAEAALHASMQENAGKYVLVVEGSIPRKDKGVYMKIAGKPAVEMLEEVAAQAAAVIGIGSCAAWGGIPSADPDPTGAVGVDAIVKDKPIVNLPGCPPNPYTLLGTVLQYARSGTLPELDDEKRPKFAYDRDIHEHCPRRAHFDAGKFARQFGDEGHRQGWCLYHLGCKGPDTHAGCSTRHFNEVVDAWPIGIGAPCIGCTEKKLAFRVPLFEVIPIHDAKPPDTYAPIESPQGSWSVPAAAVAGGVAGALLGAGYVASRKFSTVSGDSSVPGDTSASATPEGAKEKGPEKQA
jgi:hydrogenase small subunit